MTEQEEKEYTPTQEAAETAEEISAETDGKKEEKVPEDKENTSETADGNGGKEEDGQAEAEENVAAEEGEESGEKEPHGGKGRLKKELGKAREEAEKWKAEAEENKRKWYAVTAEYENYRRRTQNQTAQKYVEGRSDVIAALFPIGDNLERALAACSDEKTRQGVDMVLKSYKKVLEGEKIEEIDPLGQPFDAAVAEAIMAVPAGEGEEEGVVKQVYVKGYRRGDKILRYAQVIVTQ